MIYLHFSEYFSVSAKNTLVWTIDVIYLWSSCSECGDACGRKKILVYNMHSKLLGRKIWKSSASYTLIITVLLKDPVVHFLSVHHHHQVMVIIRISLIPPPLRPYCLSLLTGSQDCIWCSYRVDVLAGGPTLVCPCVGVYKRTLLMSLSIFHQKCLACLGHLTWMVC